jgi:two-component system chemotaxis sensor kinase CheA
MGLDMAKYRRIFLEESNDHLAEISRALLDLEKEMTSVEAIDTIFRMAHSIKSMAASLGYDSVADLAHRMEDRMEGVRSAGCIREPGQLRLLFRSLETLEAMVAAIAADQEPNPVDPALLDQLASAVAGSSTGTLSEVPEPVEPEAIAPDGVGGEPKKV